MARPVGRYTPRQKITIYGPALVRLLAPEVMGSPVYGCTVHGERWLIERVQRSPQGLWRATRVSPEPPETVFRQTLALLAYALDDRG
ncbi:MAG TPA: hypothetical protein VKB63_08670 [Gemmatimonadales bacterium]|nr:hypothetical protein [Gemmatimonadales bacterium]